jgi:hypothetical protein
LVSITLSATAPSSPAVGQLWIDDAYGIDYVWFLDSNGVGHWVEMSAPGAVGPSGSNGANGATGPTGAAGASGDAISTFLLMGA